MFETRSLILLTHVWIVRTRSIVNVEGSIQLSRTQIVVESNNSLCRLEGQYHKWLVFQEKETSFEDMIDQLDYELEILSRDGWRGVCPCQLSRDRNLQFIIVFFISIKLLAFYREYRPLIGYSSRYLFCDRYM